MEKPDYRSVFREECDTRAALAIAPTVPLMGFSVRVMTARMLAELEFVENPLVLGCVTANPEEILAFVWRIHPAFARPAPWYRSFRASLTRARIRLAIRRRGLVKANAACLRYMQAINQDAVSGGGDGPRQRKEMAHWTVAGSAFYRTAFGLTHSDYMDTPVPVLNQLYRVYLDQHGESRQVHNESDTIYIRERLMEHAAKQQTKA